MKTTTIPYDLAAWAARRQLTQRDAASKLGLSYAGYKASLVRNRRPGQPCNKTVALLAQALEEERCLN